MRPVARRNYNRDYNNRRNVNVNRDRDNALEMASAYAIGLDYAGLHENLHKPIHKVMLLR